MAGVAEVVAGDQVAAAHAAHVADRPPLGVGHEGDAEAVLFAQGEQFADGLQRLAVEDLFAHEDHDALPGRAQPPWRTVRGGGNPPIRRRPDEVATLFRALGCALEFDLLKSCQRAELCRHAGALVDRGLFSRPHRRQRCPGPKVTLSHCC